MTLTKRDYYEAGKVERSSYKYRHGDPRIILLMWLLWFGLFVTSLVWGATR